MVDLQDIRKRTLSVRQYVDGAEPAARDTMLEKYRSYKLDIKVLESLKTAVRGVTCVVFSASWCKDCKEALPVLLHLEEKVSLEVRVFGTVKTSPLKPDQKWAVPPSPPEMNEWKITHIPWIEFFDPRGKRIGTIIEKPHVKETLEAEVLYILER